MRRSIYIVWYIHTAIASFATRFIVVQTASLTMMIHFLCQFLSSATHLTCDLSDDFLNYLQGALFEFF